jgi:hypothetical protein
MSQAIGKTTSSRQMLEAFVQKQRPACGISDVQLRVSVPGKEDLLLNDDAALFDHLPRSALEAASFAVVSNVSNALVEVVAAVGTVTIENF